MKKRIWVIIPVYNAQRYIECAVNSVLAVKQGDISIVLVDDGSTDDSGAICDRIAGQHACISVIHQKNGGVSCARNTGIDYVLNQCDDGYIAFLDADDMWAPNVELQGLDADTDIVAFSSALCNESGDRYCDYHRFENKVLALNGANTQWINHGHFGAFLYRITLIKEYSLRFMPGIKGNEDIIFWRQATFCAKTVEFRKTVLYIYRMNHASVSHTWKTDTENALHIPMAWYEARKWVDGLDLFSDEEKQKWINSCEELIGARLLEVARLLCERGYSLKDVQNLITGAPVYCYLERIQENALSEWQRSDLILFRHNLGKFVWKHRIRGFALKSAKRMMRIDFVRRLREIRKYPMTQIE